MRGLDKFMETVRVGDVWNYLRMLPLMICITSTLKICHRIVYSDEQLLDTLTYRFLTAVLHKQLQQYSLGLFPLSQILKINTTFPKHLLPSSGETT